MEKNDAIAELKYVKDNFDRENVSTKEIRGKLRAVIRYLYKTKLVEEEG